MLNVIVTTVLFIALIALWGFAWVYDRGANPWRPRKYKWFRGAWKRSREGRTIMAQKIALASFISFIVFLRIIGANDWLTHWAEWIKLVGYWVITLTFIGMLINLIKLFKEKE